jgi:RNA polymerase sigma factor (sigma-70 family)
VNPTEAGGPAAYPSTLWSAVISATDRSAPDFRRGLDRLIGLYWKPVYWTLRLRWQRPPEEAKDLVQAFFLGFLEKDRLAGVGPEKGRFRVYLRVLLDNFMRNEREAERALKRGGGAGKFSIDALEEPPVASGTLPPDRVFDRAWAIQVFRDAAGTLRREYESSGRAAYFQVFELRELSDEPPPYPEIARKLSIAVHDVENYLKHARAAFQRILRAAVQETLADGGSLEEELRFLADSLR